MFITVCGQKGGVAKTCTSIHLASVWHSEGKKVCIVDADKNRSALAYASRGNLPFPVFPVSSAAKASRSSEIVITDGQASSDQEELKHLAYGSDLVILPTTAKARSVELTVELANLLLFAAKKEEWLRPAQVFTLQVFGILKVKKFA